MDFGLLVVFFLLFFPLCGLLALVLKVFAPEIFDVRWF